MKAIFHHKAAKFVDNIKDNELLKKVKFEIDAVISDPAKGKLLEHPFRKHKIRSSGFSYKGVAFRIAYISPSKDEIVFLVIDARENFYDKLKKSL